MDINILHKLLSKQIKKYLTPDCLANESFGSFINAVNDSYRNFERDKELFEHSASLNEKEYSEINLKLKSEIEYRQQSVEKLVKAIRSMEDSVEQKSINFDSENLLSLVDFLQKQIEIRKQIEIELRQAIDIAEKATQAKSEFLSMMSHEIRTPLNAIVGLTYLMQQEEASPAMIDNLKTLQFSTDNLYVLINDILDFSKIEAGKVELENIPFDFKQLISNIKRANLVKAEERNNRIKLMIDDDIPEILEGDPLRLGQIISNLVSNAVKFTIDGSIIIELLLLSKNETHVILEVSVIDSGIGILPEKQAMIFEKFTQANSETTRQFGGTGLGLVITKKLLQLYDSQIELKSEVGKGSKFHFTINLKITHQTKSKQFDSNDKLLNEETLKGVRILLVEDYAVNIKVASKFLEKWQITFEVAENGKIATEKYDVGKYDLILMDIQMPIMDGYTATENIRKIDGNVPIIALTASATMNNQDRAFTVGMNDYVTKPFNPQELFQKIAKYTVLNTK